MRMVLRFCPIEFWSRRKCWFSADGLAAAIENRPDFFDSARMRPVECILLARFRMLTRCRTLAIASAGVLLLTAAPAIAQDEMPPPPPHVRPETAALRALVDEAAERSPEIRGLIDRLEALDVTVYIRTRLFTQIDLEGRVALMAATTGRRYLMIELACGRSGVAQMATLGHELYHALEIAREPSIVDARSLAAFYARIGIQTGDTVGRQTFETEAAASAGQRARRDLLVNTTRSSHGS
jgi:hypothetical protein